MMIHARSKIALRITDPMRNIPDTTFDTYFQYHRMVFMNLVQQPGFLDQRAKWLCNNDLDLFDYFTSETAANKIK